MGSPGVGTELYDISGFIFVMPEKNVFYHFLNDGMIKKGG